MKFYILFGLSLLTGLCVVTYFIEGENRKMASIYDTNWCDEGTFVVEELAKQIDGTALGRIIVRRVDAGGGDLFSAIVRFEQDILVGSLVKIKKVEYMHHPYSRMSFMVAVKHSP